MTSSTCGVHRVVSAEIVQHRVVNGDEARDRSSVQSICGSRNEYVGKSSKAAHSDMKRQNTVPQSQALDNLDGAGASHVLIQCLWAKHLGDTYEDG